MCIIIGLIFGCIAAAVLPAIGFGELGTTGFIVVFVLGVFFSACKGFSISIGRGRFYF